MKIFRDQKDTWEDKVNFVDADNVLVGYDMGQSCCEHADYFISKTEDNEPAEDNGIAEGLEAYFFDKTYFVKVEPKKLEWGSSILENGEMVRFKLVAIGKPDLFLHLYNSHNGYYGHGFEANIDGVQWESGTL